MKPKICLKKTEFTAEEMIKLLDDMLFNDDEAAHKKAVKKLKQECEKVAKNKAELQGGLN